MLDVLVSVTVYVPPVETVVDDVFVAPVIPGPAHVIETGVTVVFIPTVNVELAHVIEPDTALNVPVGVPALGAT